MKILVTGKYDSSYNRTHILLQGLRNNTEVEITEHPIADFKTLDTTQFKKLAADADFIYLPPFTHESVKPIKKLTNTPIIFDPLISKYLTKVFDYQQISKYSPRAYKNYLKDKYSLQKSNLIIADTAEHKKYFVKTFNISPSKIVVVQVGVDTAQFYPRNKPASRNFEVGFYGGFIPLQGVTHIIEAAQILQNETDIQFKLIGTGFEWEKMKKLVQQLHLKNVHFLGWLDYPELPQKLNALDICLGIFGDTPKADMVIPNKIYHYAALKKSIITKETPAIKEIFTHQKDIVLTSNDPKAIAEQILHLKNNKDYSNKIATAGYDLITTEYNSAKMAEKLVAYLKDYNK